MFQRNTIITAYRQVVSRELRVGQVVYVHCVFGTLLCNSYGVVWVANHIMKYNRNQGRKMCQIKYFKKTLQNIWCN